MQSYQSLLDLTGYKSKAAKRIARLAEEHTEKVRELGPGRRAPHAFGMYYRPPASPTL